MRGDCVGALSFGECSRDLHSLLHDTVHSAAERHWREAEATSARAAVSVYTAIYRRRWGCETALQGARLRHRSQGSAADMSKACKPVPALPGRLPGPVTRYVQVTQRRVGLSPTPDADRSAQRAPQHPLHTLYTYWYYAGAGRWPLRIILR